MGSGIPDVSGIPSITGGHAGPSSAGLSTSNNATVQGLTVNRQNNAPYYLLALVGLFSVWAYVRKK